MNLVELSKQYTHRYELFPYLINTLGLTKGVEVGVKAGKHAENLLRNCPQLHLTCVDLKFEGEAFPRLEPFGDRVAFLEKPSIEAAQLLDETFDFVHIDACHRYPFVRDDIAAWWSKLVPGGLFSGDDYIFFDKFGVIKAVDEFEQQYGKQINLLVLGAAPAEERHQFVRKYVKPKGKGFYKTIVCWWCLK
jgi:hypothetical protein